MEVQRHLQLTATTATGGLWTRLQRFAGVLSPYCSTIDTLVQHDPHNTALVWGSIRVIIQVCRTANWQASYSFRSLTGPAC